jgi:hypothetical protein
MAQFLVLDSQSQSYVAVPTTMNSSREPWKLQLTMVGKTYPNEQGPKDVRWKKKAIVSTV